MKIIALLITRMVATRFVAVLLGIAFFVVSLEVVSYSSEILNLAPGSSLIVPEYIAYRLPGTLLGYLPISMLIAILLTLTELSHRNEMTAMLAAGLSPARLVVLLLPLAFVVGGINFLLGNSAVPAAVPTLRDWGIGDYGKEKFKVDRFDPIWMRSGPDILRAASANAESTKLHDVIIFRRDADGLLREQIYAKDAVIEGERWLLSDVLVYYRGTQAPNHLDEMVYSGNIRPAAAGSRSGDPEEMSIADLNYFIDNSGFGIRPVWVYQTWWHKRLSLFFSALLMIAMSVPLMARFRRGGGLGLRFASGIGLGFLFFVGEGVSATMGEQGLLTPWLSAWLPLAVFAALAAVLLARSERVA